MLFVMLHDNVIVTHRIVNGFLKQFQLTRRVELWQRMFSETLVTWAYKPLSNKISHCHCIVAILLYSIAFFFSYRNCLHYVQCIQMQLFTNNVSFELLMYLYSFDRQPVFVFFYENVLFHGNYTYGPFRLMHRF